MVQSLLYSLLLVLAVVVTPAALAQEHPGDIEAYTAGKRAFVGRVLAAAGLGFGRR